MLTQSQRTKALLREKFPAGLTLGRVERLEHFGKSRKTFPVYFEWNGNVVRDERTARAFVRELGR